MSFHAQLLTVWPQDLRTSLGLASADQVYFGRRRQKVPRADLEIWIERLAVEERGSSFQRIRRHPYLVHLVTLASAGPKKTGATELERIETLLRALVERYAQAVPFLVGTVVATEAQEERVDLDPEDLGVVEGVARVTFWVKE